MEEYSNNYYQSINKTEGAQTKKVVDNFRFTLLNKKEKKLCQTRR
jgi:hypothetical protein